ncbi:MAG: hypothetical protein AAGH15_13680 [Myxococcota bacterium]
MPAPTINYQLTEIDRMDGGGNSFSGTGVTASDAQGGVGFAAGNAGITLGTVDLVTSPSDFSTRQYLYFQMACQTFDVAGNLESLANGGMAVRLTDRSANWSQWNIAGADVMASFSPSISGIFDQFLPIGAGFGADAGMVWVVDLDRTPDSTNGTLDLTDVESLGLSVHRNAGSFGAPEVFIGRINVADRIQLVDGEAGNPCRLQTLNDAQQSWPNDANSNVLWDTVSTFLAGGSSSRPYFCLYGLDIGDGSTLTRFEETSSALVLAASREAQVAADVDTYGAPFQGDAGADGYGRLLRINQSASDLCAWTDCVISGTPGEPGEFAVTVLGSPLATCTFTRTTVSACATFTAAHATLTGCLFENVEELAVGVATTITGLTYRGSPSSARGLRITSAPGDYSALGIIFDVTNDPAAVDLTVGDGGAGTYTLLGLQVSGGRTLRINNPTVNAVTVQLTPGTAFEVVSGSGPVTVEASDAPTISLTGIVEDSRVFVSRVVGAADVEELANVVAPASGEVVVSPGLTSGYAVRISIRKASASPLYQPFDVGSLASPVTVPSAGLTLPVSQTLDE